MPNIFQIQDGFANSIHDSASNVNTTFKNIFETQQFIRWFGDWQNYPEKASKVVDENGIPLIVYHGSDITDITIFKTTNENGTGGLYLSTNRKVAEAFAGKNGKVYESYVNLRRPLIIDADGAYYDSIPTPSEMVGSSYALGKASAFSMTLASRKQIDKLTPLCYNLFDVSVDC